MAQELELLAPAGTLQTLKAVIHAGADAVYFGGSRFGARAYAGNFNQEEVLEAIDFGHLHGSKVMLAVNTLLKENEIEEQLYEYLLPYYEQGLDAVIVQDFGVMRFIRRNFKDLPVHTSTQMTVANVEGAEFLAAAGAKRIVLARELSLEEIHKIHKEVTVELESFVHGALCYCYSGQCLFSSILGGRSGNRGRCAQPCRLPYEVYDAKEKRIYAKGHMYPLSPKDLCTIDLIPQLAKSGVYSFKIEGRMKQSEYAAGVVSVYRKYMDRYLAYGEEEYHVSKEDHRKLFDFGNRSGFTEGYYKQWNGPEMITFERPGHEKSNEKLWEQTARDYVQSECKELICGKLKVRKENPIELTVKWQDTEITVTGDLAMTAQNQPVTKETLYAKLNKIGNTPFAWKELTIDLEEGLFLSMGAVNALRRRALEKLKEQCVKPYRRMVQEKKQEQKAQKKTDRAGLCITASAETEEQIFPLLESPVVSTVYVDSIVFPKHAVVTKMQEISKLAKKTGKQIYYILPSVFRNHTSVFYQSVLPKIEADGFLAKSYDALAFLLKHKIKPERIRIDHNLYTWSTESRMAFFALGIEGDTIPLELNRKEIRQRDNENSEMLIYGYLPLMTSVQCINRNFHGCDSTKKLHYIKDRYGISFPVKNHCSECYNVIYNSKPLYLFSMAEELQTFGITRFRLSFTIESESQVNTILKTCQDMVTDQTGKRLSVDMKDYTYGHYKRGVE